MSYPILTAAFTGLTPQLLRVESSLVSGFARLQVVGNVGDISRDGSERVRSALERINQPVPNQRVVVSVTPADLPKHGNHFDLPVAVSLLQLTAQRPWRIDPTRWLFAGELALDGQLRGTRGGAAFVTVALKQDLEGIVVPIANLRELRLMQSLNNEQFGSLRLIGFNNLHAVLDWLETGENPSIMEMPSVANIPGLLLAEKNFDDMHLPPQLERLACTIAAGKHSCLLRGSPGCGKTMFAERLPSVLPLMQPAEHLQTLSIQTTASAKVPAGILAGFPPFRAPHHQASSPSVLGTTERPGELSLAHGGILFLDEFPEFRRDVIEALREPLETGVVQICRAKLATTWSAKVILIAAANNCPCGWFGSARQKCGCNMAKVRAYRDKLSGPILERIDLHVDIPDPTHSTSELFAKLPKASHTEKMRTIVRKSIAFAKPRLQRHGVSANRDIPAHLLLSICGIDAQELSKWLTTLTDNRPLGHRSAVRLLRVTRTLADLDGVERVTFEHLQEAWGWHAAGAAAARCDQFVGL